MTPTQERRLIYAALGYAAADAALQTVRNGHRCGHAPDPEGKSRARAALERRRWKLILLRAAGAYRKQPLLQLERARR